MSHNARLKTEAEKRRQRWNKAEKPYYAACLTCVLSCEQTIAHGSTAFDITHCPKAVKGYTFFPYKLETMMKEEKEQTKRR